MHHSPIILYVFRRPVLEELKKIPQGLVPHDFFYGATVLSRKFHVHITDKVFTHKSILAAQIILNKMVTSFFLDNIGFSLIPAFFILPEIKKSNLVFATADTYGIPLALLKRLTLFNKPLVVNTVGLYDGLIKKNNPLARSFCNYVLTSVDFFVAGGSFQECVKLSKLLHIPLEKFIFIPFGIDIAFFKPRKVKEKNYILIIGADPSRDWELYAEVARKMPQERFHIVTHEGLIKIPMPKNVTFEYSLPITTLRSRIYEAKCILILSKLNHHFAGQSTALRSMSCGKAVIFTHAPGVEEYSFRDGKHCKLVPVDDVHGVIEAISFFNRSREMRGKVGKNARNIIEKLYTIERYSSKLQTIFERVLHIYSA